MIPDVLARRAADEPGRTAYVFLDEIGAERTRLSYGELHARAVAVAARLAGVCAPGDRALLLFGQGPGFVVAFLGCLYAGVVAVPVNPPRRNRVQDATRAIVVDCEPAAVLTVAAMLDHLRPAVEPLAPGVRWITLDDLPPGEFETRSTTSDTLAFLQYTSGSTSTPKGVMVSHGNLAANQDMIRRAFGHDRDSTVVGWAPFFHDQGLIGNVLQPLWVGATSVQLSAMAFARRPLLWLTTISRYRAHTSGGPNFGFDACVAAATRAGVPDVDLRSWEVAFDGAEPVRPDTLHRFAETFAPVGFDPAALHPCYGLAEATLMVSGTGRLRGPRTVRADAAELGRLRFVAAPDGRVLAGSGTPVAPGRVRIVDPETRMPCAPGEVGEIWVAGDHVAQGYWRRPEATEQTFRAMCDGRPHLRTGDLGVVVDGELYVVGRIKDLVIVRGRNHYPHDIEHTAAAAHPALRTCAAFAVPDGDGERLVVVAEVRREHSDTLEARDVVGSVRAAVLTEHEMSGEVVLTSFGRLPVTSSGKIMRAATRTRYLDGDYAAKVNV
ncbi:MAG: fatty acyl-AMP ligase [Pseudonocardia sp.]|nr:fatty acyl-AMP ligase [Pseudonocardia sp.]